MVRRSERVYFPGHESTLSGIVDLPDDIPRATAVFTHCFTCTKDLKTIVRISRGLAEQGFAVLRYDLTGLGSSEGDFSHSNFSTNRADLQAAVTFLSEYLAAPSFLLGHSFGGACSLSLAQDLPTIRGVVSLAAPSDTQHLADLLHRMDPQVASSGMGTVTIGGRQYTIRDSMLADFRAYDLPAQLRQLSKPTLLFHSPNDETLGFEHVLRLFALLTQRTGSDPTPSPSSLVCLPGADHLLIKQPADLPYVTSVIAAWFERILAS
ncbi:MAG: alpha/beta fold hydrolase [Pirellulaceae bacterium]